MYAIRWACIKRTDYHLVFYTTKQKALLLSDYVSNECATSSRHRQCRKTNFGHIGKWKIVNARTIGKKGLCKMYPSERCYAWECCDWQTRIGDFGSDGMFFSSSFRRRSQCKCDANFECMASSSLKDCHRIHEQRIVCMSCWSWLHRKSGDIAH